MRRLRPLAGALLLLAVAAFPARRAAASPADNAAASPAPDLSSVIPDNSWIDRTHAYISQGSLDTVQWFDDFFGDKTREDVAPAESTLRWRNNFRLGTDQTFRYRTDLRASIRLRQLSRKLRLVFSSETFEDALGVTRDGTGGQGLTPGGTFRQSSTELRYEFLQTARSQADVGAGVRIRLPLVFYTRARYRYTLPLSAGTQLRFWPTAFWRTHDGLGQSVAVDLEHRLGKETFFRWANSETTTEESAGMEWNSEPGILRALAPGKAATFAVGVNGATRPESRITGFYALVRYRQTLFREWIFVEVEPIQSWNRGDTGGYGPVSSVTFRLEALFRGIRG